MEANHMDKDTNENPKKRKCLSRLLTNVNALTVVLCWYTLTFFMTEMYYFAVITSIEKRFGFRSSSTGSLISIKEIAYVSVVALSSHFGNKWHAPRYLALMAILMALSSGLLSLPHFLYGSPFYVISNSTNSTDENNPMTLCQTEDNTTHVNNGDCDTEDSGLVKYNSAAYTIFAVGSFVMGFAQAPMVCITTTCIDDAVGPVKNSLYLAFLVVMRAIGPVLAFLLGALFTSFHESLKDPGYDASDPRFVGAWWLGYLLFPFLLLSAAILIAPFPKTMPRTWEKEEGTYEMTIKKKTEEKRKENVIKDLFRALFRLLCNPIYMALVAGGCFIAYVLAGMFPFLPKYIEVQFQTTASTANLLTGVLGSMLAAVGGLSGGVICSRMKLKNGQSAFFLMISALIFAVCIFVTMFITCPAVNYVGANNEFIETCSATCGCVENQFEPVCGSDGLTYSSACKAGCKQYQNETLGDCSCVGDAGTAMPGTCNSGCKMHILYMVALGVGIVIGSMGVVPGTTICLRCVEERDRSLGLGVLGTVVSLLGFMLGPILYGLLIDSTCALWSDPCSNSGYCKLYDNDEMRFRLHGVTGMLQGLAAFFYFIVWVLIRREEKKICVTKENIEENPPPELPAGILYITRM